MIISNARKSTAVNIVSAWRLVRTAYYDQMSSQDYELKMRNNVKSGDRTINRENIELNNIQQKN